VLLRLAGRLLLRLAERTFGAWLLKEPPRHAPTARGSEDSTPGSIRRQPGLRLAVPRCRRDGRSANKARGGVFGTPGGQRAAVTHLPGPWPASVPQLLLAEWDVMGLQQRDELPLKRLVAVVPLLVGDVGANRHNLRLAHAESPVARLPHEMLQV